MRRPIGIATIEAILSALMVATLLLTLPMQNEISLTEVVTETIVMIVTLIAVTAIASLGHRSASWIALMAGATGFYLATILDVVDEVVERTLFMHITEDVFFIVGLSLLTVGLVVYVREQRSLLQDVEDTRNRLAELSITDGLTGLYNSRHFYDRLNEEIERSKRYSRPLTILLFDIDNFKQHNDEYGHIAGDGVLKGLGDTVSAILRENDSAYRYGGEEFTVLLPETDEAHAKVVAERIRASFAEKRFDGGSHKTISVGVAEFKNDEDPKSFVKRADDAMYRAKRRGKNSVVSSSTIEN